MDRVRLPGLIVLTLTLAAVVPALADPPVFPGKAWAVRSPDEVDLDAEELHRLRDYMGGRGCVVRHGYLVYTWGDVRRRADVASACKPVFVHLLFQAIEDGKIPSLDTPVVRWEPRLEGLNATLGFNDRKITWRHLASQTSCYGVQEAPGEAYDYSDYNMALLFDTLTEKVDKVPRDRVDAAVLRPHLTDLLECEDRPTLMAFGLKNRPGRLGISVRDFARFGLLYLHHGSWNGKQILRSEHAREAVTNPVAATVPRTAGTPAEMIRGQRSIGGGNNQTDHFGSYSLAWWINGTDRDGRRHWPHAPTDTYAALGHGGRRGLAVIPSLDLVLSWNDSRLNGPETEDRAFELLVQAVQ